jgi:hypothetical protein
MKKERAREWCLGYGVPVIIIAEDGSTENGTVSALDPRQENLSEKQPRGLFLDGPVMEYEFRGKIRTRNGTSITVTTLDGKNVTKYIKMSFGPGM